MMTKKGINLPTDDSSKEGKPVTEPLPPGVDPPEIAYTLPASALEAGVLYGAQQTNPIYAATLAGAGIPLLPHHHTALMQGQLMHYNPAYHQHLHNVSTRTIPLKRVASWKTLINVFIFNVEDCRI